MEIQGAEADRVSADCDNLLYQAFGAVYTHLGRSIPSVKVTIDLQVPLARGLGSSATAIVGGLMGANVLAGYPLSLDQLLGLAIDLEGHPDNVVPALLGGCRLAASDVAPQVIAPQVIAPQATASEPTASKPSVSKSALPWQICAIPWHPDVMAVVAVPDFELSTEAARQVLPQDYGRGDAIFNVAHLGLLLRGLETGHGDWLRAALVDRIHQPYRQTLIPGFTAVQGAAISAGAYGVVISGAGPTLLALTALDRVEAVQQAMAQAWHQEQIQALVKCVGISQRGAIVDRVDADRVDND
jgi:homoserine kinase